MKSSLRGLRSGEKLYEELLNNEENTIPTHHPKILIAKIQDTAPSHEIQVLFKQLENACIGGEEDSLVNIMKALLPEYRSSVSRFEKLDRKTDTAPATLV